MTEVDIYLYWYEFDDDDIDGFFMLPDEETAQSSIWKDSEDDSITETEEGEIHIVWW